MDGYGEVLSFAEDLGISPREAAAVIDGWCDQISERITGDKVCGELVNTTRDKI